MGSTYIIAEAGVNHNGSLDLARQLVETAADCGADAVKFQTFKAENLVTRSAGKARYQNESTDASESQFNMLRKLELSEQDHRELFQYARELNIDFLSTPFDLDSVDVLRSIGISRYKIPSGEITNGPYLLKVARQKLPVILSTGMSLLGEVEFALSVIAFGYLNAASVPTEKDLVAAYSSAEGQKLLKEHVTLLHATTEYPAPYESVNLKAMLTMQSAFQLPIGYSDHTVGNHVSLAAVALGASIIEKHITLDRNLPGPDHQASTEPEQFKVLVKQIRDIENALGTGIKVPHPAELDNMNVARKSIIASSDIRKGDKFTPDNISVKRPGNGISARHYWSYIGRDSNKDYLTDDLIEE